MNIGSLKISARLQLGFGLLLALLVLLALIGNNALHVLNQETSEMAEKVWPRARAANFALDNVRGSYGRLAQLVSANDPEVAGAASKKLVKDVNEFNEGIEDLDKLLETEEERHCRPRRNNGATCT